ncbi:lipoate--protein ligase family protein [archaeon]|jgi:lipoate---protein ligase|nr:lipoate--protein ligase family protein [archaeon]MBT4021789.1 lipoate--protein ligase family protein [archaeon]MBT4271796.1 lipoate--protein ligase family protein [archaeon]MBT4460509.1 lipoate--protein ligase family protein [archaeon]MBT4858529.1 lipoate--protein ligase family protein [archaeon]
MRWRVIPFDYHNAAKNMAIDEAIMESVKAGGKPTIRFYGWFPSAVSIGYFQSMDQVVNLKKCEELGVGIVRRRTGGGSVYHSNSGEITYSLIAPEEMFPKNIIESYREICGYVIKGLKNLGIESEFKPINDIGIGHKKISGNAQTRRNGILLQHGTILYDVHVGKMFAVLNVPSEKIKDKLIKSVQERVTRILDFECVGKEQVYEALLKGFVEHKEFDFGDLTNEEEKRIEELIESKYKSKKWNFMK